jgi:hypothetical protein
MSAVFAALLGVVSAPALDFPPPDKLPSRPDLPDPLVAFAGKTVTTPDEWHSARRPELKALFQHYMYGTYPKVTPKVSSVLLFEDKEAFGGAATLREVAVTMADGAPPVHVLLSVPNARPGPAPVFVGLNFAGNHTLTDHPKVRVTDAWVRPAKPKGDNRATADGRNKQPDAYPFDLAAGRGYAVATAYYGEIVPDDPKVRGGLSELLMPTPCCDGRPAGETGAVMAWAWGMHRIVDYVSTLPDIDPKRVAAVGHSRLGKATLAATAFDDRIAVGFPHQAGAGGSGPSRSHNPAAETAKRVATAFPHWFAPNYVKFGDDPTKLPFDQNGLVAVCAPRPVLFTAATGDQWANPPGQFDVLKAASPAYRLLGVEGVAADAMPPEGKLIESRLGYWVRPGKHETNRADWGAFLAFADKWLK